VKLLGGYVIVAVLVLVVGYFGLTGARNLSADIGQIGRNILPKVNSLQILKEVQSAYGREESNLMRRDLDPLSVHDAYARMHSAKMRQDNAIQVY
jgi:methyl-accepting chemotaxis protein